MIWTTVAKGNTASSLSSLASYESLIPEGSKGRLDLFLKSPVSSSILPTLESTLATSGVPEAKVSSSGTTLSIFFRKKFPPLAILAAIVIGLIALAILVVGWQLYKELASTLPMPVLIIGALAVIALIVVITVFIAKNKIPVGGST